MRGRYDGDRTRLYLGTGSGGEKHGERGFWGPYGNGFVGGVGVGYLGGYGYGQGQAHCYGYTPGPVAVRGHGGYNRNGEYVGNPYARRKGGLLGCFGL